MSGICGIFHRDGRPADPQDLRRMMTPMAYWGPDGSATWIEGPVGLGHLMLHNTPESLHDILPRQSPSGDLAITARVRLDNRDELFSALRTPPSERAAVPDGMLILKAYEAWGEACCDRLLGDWSFAIWNARDRTLFLARDHHGNTGIYYHLSSRLLAFASSMKALLALPEVPRRLNELRVAQILIAWSSHGPSTAYQDILRLPPAHSMTVGPGGAEVRRYWFLENVPGLRLKSDAEYVEAFMGIYSEAVRCRLRSLRPVGATLSGGLDSGSVSVLAAKEMGMKGRRLPAFTSVPLREEDVLTEKDRVGDETPLANATARHAGNIDVHAIRAEQITPVAGIERALFLHDEPGHAAANAYWIVSLMATARDQGVGTLLTGQGGNATVSWHAPQYLLRLARHGRWLRLCRELRAQRSFRPAPLWRAFGAQVARAFAPALFQRLVDRRRRPPASRHEASGEPWSAYSAIHPDLARRLDLRNRMAESGHDPTFTRIREDREHRLAVIRPGRAILGFLWQEIGAGFGIEVRDPTWDKRVLEFCLAIPDDQHFRHGHGRWLIRRSMDGLLPAEVLWNRRRGRQAADVAGRLKRAGQETRRALQEIGESALARQFLEVRRLGDILAELDKPLHAALQEQCGTILLRGIMAGLFLARFEGGMEAYSHGGLIR